MEIINGNFGLLVSKKGVDSMIEKPTKIYFAFSQNSRIWWVRMLCKKYRHIIIIFEFNKKSLILEPAFNRWELGFSNKRFLKKLEQNGWKILEVQDKKSETKNYLFSISCVSVCKSVLGIHNPFIRTPRQLLNKLNS